MSITSNVFVTVGSTDFDALVQVVDQLAPLLGLQGTMQIGWGQYVPANAPYFRFAPELDSYYERASLVIAHGGLATTMEVLRRGIPLVSVSNADRYDNHQDDLLATLAEEGYLVWCRRLDELRESIELAGRLTTPRYTPPDCTIHLVIHEFLDALASKSRHGRT